MGFERFKLLTSKLKVRCYLKFGIILGCFLATMHYFVSVRCSLESTSLLLVVCTIIQVKLIRIENHVDKNDVKKAH